MWDTRHKREPDTLTWFPQQFTMPTPSALDIIAAGIQDIATILNHPGPNSPLNPLTTQQAAALRNIVTIFNGVLPVDDDEDTPSRLRVETEKEGEPQHGVLPVDNDKGTPSRLRVKTEKEGELQPASTPPLPTPTLPITYADAICRKSRGKATPKPTTPAVVAPVPPSNTRRRSQLRCMKCVIQSKVAKQTTNIPASSDQKVFWILHSTAINLDTEAVTEYDELSKCSNSTLWIQSNTEEFGCLAQGLGPDSEMPEGTDTLFFIHPNQMTNGRKATYLCIVCADRPEKTQPRCVRHTIGGDQINYPGSTSTKTADLTTVKTLFNSVISTPDGRFMTVNLKDFFFGTPLEDRYEYIRIPVHVIPPRIMELYNLHALVINGFFYAKV
jgi:hypothetical protein